MLKRVLISILLVLIVPTFFPLLSFGQESSLNNPGALSQEQMVKYLNTIGEKFSKCERKIIERSKKALENFIAQEKNIQQKLLPIDSAASAATFTNSFEKYLLFQKQLENKANQIKGKGLGAYIPYLDTIKTSLNFLNSEDLPLKGEINVALEKVDDLKNRFSQIHKLQEFIRERKEYLTGQLQKFNLTKDLKKLNKEIFYYTQAIKSYKDVLSDPKKIEQQALNILKGVPQFQEFLRRNSQLAAFFGGSQLLNTQSSLVGLQTRVGVQQMITRNYTSASPASFVQQQMQNAAIQSTDVRDKPAFPDAFGGTVDVPDFKPNMQKTKSFTQRLEYGTNIQFGNTNHFLPTTADIALSVGYKLNDEGSVGIGSSYKLGLGKGIENIRFSHQGTSIRSYVDWKMKGSIYLSGGYEKLYLPTLESVSSQFDTWQNSGLLGLSKKYKISSKMKGSIQLLYDFLSTNSLPKRQPIVFRTGWNF